MFRRFTAAAVSFALAWATLTGGCATAESSALAGARVTPEQYAGMFQAARDTLRDYRFALDRVDAPQGVLTTAPRSDPGLVAPWNANSGTAAAVNDLVGYQERTVQVAFVTGPAPTRAAGAPVIPLTDPDRDLVASPLETTMFVRVAVHRVERPERRVSIDSVRIERQAVDPALREQDLWPSYLVPAQDDSVLAAELLRAILARNEAKPPAAAEQPATLPAQPPAEPSATPTAAQ